MVAIGDGINRIHDVVKEHPLKPKMPQFAAFGSLLINLILGTVVVLEFIGPIFTKYALKKAGEIN